MSPAPDMWWSWSGKKRGGPRNSRPRRKGNAGANARPGGAGGSEGPRLRIMNYAEAAAKPKTAAAAARPWPLRLGTGHTLIVASNLRTTPRSTLLRNFAGGGCQEMGVAVNRMRKARGQKVVLSCSLSKMLKDRGAAQDTRRRLKGRQARNAAPTVIIRDVLRSTRMRTLLGR
ncbi:hypothetical protein EVAR_11065_1 [Eumeta japonica]|uniref:Uncharacterized protein n=1 Tax=Eumeta variegata TaxID=151549 RepID=A0A4C1U4Y6_EUMVA|nr:hypothetical protein EVAR_11065_1 [Eumeta japonica]